MRPFLWSVKGSSPSQTPCSGLSEEASSSVIQTGQLIYTIKLCFKNGTKSLWFSLSSGDPWTATETTQGERISYLILIFCQQMHSVLWGNNSRQIEELHGCFEVIYSGHRFSARWIWVCNSLWWSVQARQCPRRGLWSHFTLCAEQGLLKQDPVKPSPQELDSQPGLEAIQGVTNNGNIIICCQTHLHSIFWKKGIGIS